MEGAANIVTMANERREAGMRALIQSRDKLHASDVMWCVMRQCDARTMAWFFERGFVPINGVEGPLLYTSMSPLHVAIGRCIAHDDAKAKLRYLIAKGADINIGCQTVAATEDTPLQYALVCQYDINSSRSSRMADIIPLLLKAGAGVSRLHLQPKEHKEVHSKWLVRRERCARATSALLRAYQWWLGCPRDVARLVARVWLWETRYAIEWLG